MASSTCPACNAVIDPARAPVARVRGGRVVTFCSRRCADAPESEYAALRAQAAPAAAQPAASPAGTSAAPGESASAEGVAGAAGATGDDRYERAERRPRGGGKRRVIALSSAILVGGMVITIINAVSPSTPVDVRAASNGGAERQPATTALPGGATPGTGAGQAMSGATTGTAPETAPETTTATAGQAQGENADAEAVPADPYDNALRTLIALMKSPSPRVQRIAAMALSRLGTNEVPEAIDVLVRLLDEEASELGRIEIAYALARAGDRRGRQMLVASLKDERRDIRLDAARCLVQLGDDAGNTALEHLLDLPTHRLGVASMLARRGNEKGLAALREVLGDEESTNELTMRALVALGMAGDASVRDRLVEILNDGRYHVGAADALAALGDRAAIPALMHQLGLPSLRVRAALALRRLGETVPLDELDRALTQGNEAARVSAAEAILLLAGPKNLAELD
jgi:HEAT repeat protein